MAGTLDFYYCAVNYHEVKYTTNENPLKRKFFAWKQTKEIWRQKINKNVSVFSKKKNGTFFLIRKNDHAKSL